MSAWEGSSWQAAQEQAAKEGRSATFITGPNAHPPHRWKRAADRDALFCQECGTVITGQELSLMNAAAKDPSK